MTTQIIPTAEDAADEDRSVAQLPTATDIEDIARRFRPINDQVLVKLDPVPKMAGLIHIPDSVRDSAPKMATVVKVGPGERLRGGRRATPDFGPGDRVQLTADPGWEIGGAYRLLRVGAVLGVERTGS
jgi:co-chaperonin GroES (HSP10)